MMDGFQESFTFLYRNIPGGGLGQHAMPFWHHLNLPKNIPPSEWVSFCTSYSTTLHKLHQYQDGLKVFSYTFLDKIEDPMPSHTFQNLFIGGNLRGLITDLNIYSSYFDEAAMVEWTRGCTQRNGDIFAWNPTQLYTTYVGENKMRKTIVSIDKKAICIDPKVKVKHQKAIISGSPHGGSIYHCLQSNSKMRT